MELPLGEETGLAGGLAVALAAGDEFQGVGDLAGGEVVAPRA